MNPGMDTQSTVAIVVATIGAAGTVLAAYVARSGALQHATPRRLTLLRPWSARISRTFESMTAGSRVWSRAAASRIAGSRTAGPRTAGPEAAEDAHQLPLEGGAMTQYLPRSAWTEEPRGGKTLTGGELVGVSVHYPAVGDVRLADASRKRVAGLLRGWRDYHVDVRGWSDIGYQVAIDGAGRVWDLRGIDRVPAATASDANPDANHEWGACLFIVGDTERPTAAAIEAFRDWRATRWLARWPKATRIVGHGQVPGAQTACPGRQLLSLINAGDLNEEEEMPTPEEIAAAVWRHRIMPKSDPDRVKGMLAQEMMAQVHHRAGGARDVARAIAADLKDQPLDGMTQPQVEAAVEAAVRRILGGLDSQ